MSNMHRIMWLDSQIRENKYPNRNALAERFEISIRQAQRDIDYLKDSMRAPLQYDARERGYFYEEKSFMLPNIYINEEQKRLLSFLSYSYQNYSQTPKVKKIVELFKRFSGDEHSIEELPIFDLNKSITETLYQLAEAIRNRNKVKLIYRDSDQGELEYTIHPYRLFNKYRVDYVYGFCEGHRNNQSFRIDRVLQLMILENRYEVDFELLNQTKKGFMERDPFIAKIKFTSEPRFTNSKGIRIFEIENLIYHIHFYDEEDFVQQLMMMDEWEMIHSPNWLKRKLEAKCREILDKLNQ